MKELQKRGFHIISWSGSPGEKNRETAKKLGVEVTEKGEIITDKKMKVLSENRENPRKSRATDRFADTLNN